MTLILTRLDDPFTHVVIDEHGRLTGYSRHLPGCPHPDHPPERLQPATTAEHWGLPPCKSCQRRYASGRGW